ncbi:MAG: universal stress protein [Myxococcota bacterium]|nr:universal stress protein [Myxococcota bacterium]
MHFFVHARLGDDPAAAILELASDVGADLIVVGIHG